jgi:hypothetical protein
VKLDKHHDLYQGWAPEALGSLSEDKADFAVLAGRCEVYVASVPHQVGVTSRSSGFGRFMQILARQNSIGTNTPHRYTIEIYPCVIRHPEGSKNA